MSNTEREQLLATVHFYLKNTRTAKISFFTYEKLNKIADDLIAGKDVDL